MDDTATLEITTPSEREVVVRRVFDAPPDLVFDALTRPELLRRWYGPAGWTLVVCDIDLRVGGAFHLVSRREDGRDVGQRGVYREISRPGRIVNTEWWDDWNPGECLVTTVLTSQGGKTLFTGTTLFPSREVRDTILESGLRDSASVLYDKLAALLAESA